MGCLNCTSGLICQVCDEDYILLNSGYCVSKGLSVQVNVTAALLDGVSIIGNSLCVGTSLPTNLGFASKMIRNTRYLNVPVSNALQSAFHAWKTRSNFLNAPGTWSERNSSGSLPFVFKRYHVESGFLINYWQSLIMVLIGLSVFVIFKALELVHLVKSRKQTIWYSTIKAVKISASNFAVAQFYGSLDDIIFFFVLEVRAKRSSDGFTNFSPALAIIFLLLALGVVSLHIFIILKDQRRIRRIGDHHQQLNQFLAKYENIKILYADFYDSSLPQQSFLLVNAFRSVIASVFMVTLHDYPLVLTIILTVLSLSILAYLYLFRPFREYINTCAQYFCQIILLIVNICMLILVCVDRAGFWDENAVERLSTAVVVLYLIMIIGSSVFILVLIFLMLYGVYQERRLKVRTIIPIKEGASNAKSTLALEKRQDIYKEKESISDQNQQEENSKSESVNIPLNSHQQTSSNEILDLSKIHQTLESSSIQTDRPLIQNPVWKNATHEAINSSEADEKTPRILEELDLGKSNFSN